MCVVTQVIVMTCCTATAREFIAAEKQTGVRTGCYCQVCLKRSQEGMSIVVYSMPTIQ